MKTRNQKSNILKAFILLISFISCDSKGVFNTYTAMPNNLWTQKEPVHFEFAIEDTISKNNLFITLRNNQDYKYSNLYLTATLNFPNGRKIIDTLQYEMTDKTGKFLGTGISEIKDNKLFYKENVRFPISGTFSIDIHQAMRKIGEVEGIEALEGITDVGFKIEKIE